MISQNFCVKMVAVNLRNFHTVCEEVNYLVLMSHFFLENISWKKSFFISLETSWFDEIFSVRVNVIPESAKKDCVTPIALQYLYEGSTRVDLTKYFRWE